MKRLVSLCAAAAIAGGVLLGQTIPEPRKQFGASITGAFEGWYYNEDGTRSFLVGYFNRNTQQEIDIPIVFVSGHGDVPTAVSAIKGGAVDFLQKPFDYRAALATVQRAFERDAQSRDRRATRARLAERLAALTAREREVMHRIIEGKPNKMIAEELGISVRTVEFHRANVMEKMGATSVAALIQLIALHDLQA